MLLQVLFVLSIATAPLLATNTAGEPTDITNWPPCAVRFQKGPHGIAREPRANVVN